MQLRAALTTRAKDAVLAVVGWQFVNCCRLWTAVLARAVGAEPGHPLAALVFPLAQTLLGAARLVPTPACFPLRLHLAAMLAELSWATRVYIPVVPLLLDILASPALSATCETVRAFNEGLGDEALSHERIAGSFHAAVLAQFRGG